MMTKLYYVVNGKRFETLKEAQAVAGKHGLIATGFEPIHEPKHELSDKRKAYLAGMFAK